MTRCGLFILLFFLWFRLQAQVSGYGLIDGLYGFTVHLVENETDYLEGTIQYEHETTTHLLVANFSEDTLRLQEMDEYLNPISSVFAIRDGSSFSGQWYDIKRNHQLPVRFYPGQTSAEMEYYAQRYNANNLDDSESILFTLALSPTVVLGKFIFDKTLEVRSFSGITLVDTTMYYAEDGPINLQHKGEIIEQVVQQSIMFRETWFSMEALIPDFSEPFTTRLTDQVSAWNQILMKKEELSTATRFPIRYYAICDIDYWNDDWISGSFEYVGPGGSIDGFTFIYDRRGDRFISFDELMRSGDFEDLESSIKQIELGLSFDYFGLIYKGKFDPINNRNSRHISWADLDIKVKRKLNEIHN